MEVCRALATLRWSDVMSVCFDEPRRDAYQWLVKPSRKMRFYDAVFLAHLLYDDYAARRIRHINAQFISQDPSAHIFMEAAPWFRGKGKLRCRGRWINGGNTFLCLNLSGSSQPVGEEIQWLTKKLDSSDGEEGGHIVLPRPVRTAEAEEFINEHSHMAPDGHAETIIVKPPPFKLLGPKRPVKKRKEVIKTDRGRLGPNPLKQPPTPRGKAPAPARTLESLSMRLKPNWRPTASSTTFGTRSNPSWWTTRIA